MTFSVLQMTFSSISALNSALELGYPPINPKNLENPENDLQKGQKGVFFDFEWLF